MSQEGVDKTFWEMVQPLRDEGMDGRAVIFEELRKHKTVRAVARLWLKNGVVGDNIVAHLHRRMENEFGVLPLDTYLLVGSAMTDLIGEDYQWALLEYDYERDQTSGENAG